VRGSAYVFQRDALGNWIEVQKMTGDAKQHDGFGVWVSLDGSLDGGAIVGAALDDDNGTQSGSACVFQRHSDGTWYQTHKLTASDAMEGDYFGKSVLSGDRAIVGATGDDDKGVLSGSAYVFERPLFQFNKKFVCSIAKCGPDLNFDGVTDHVVEVKSHTSTEYLVGITFRNPLRAPALIEELVPREWEVVSYSAAKREDLVLVAPDGNRGFKGYRATRIQWFPTGNDSSLVYTLRLRKHDARRYLPADCGCLRLPGASALDTNGLRRLLDNDGKPLVSNALAVAAVSDVNRDGTIDYTGNGDEDGDGLTDLREACELGTNPCKADTDGDGTPDAVDRASLDGCIR
jgi:hypothetical protein